MNPSMLTSGPKRPLTIILRLFFLVATFLASCSSNFTPSAPTPTIAAAKNDRGTLQIRANGEDFIRQGFVSKDGWTIEFDRADLTLADVTAYQTDPPFDPNDTRPLQAKTQVSLEGIHTVDLAAGDDNAEPILIGEVTAPAGQYNALSWKLVPAPSGEAKGYPLWLAGRASKDGKTLNFTLKIQPELAFRCGEFVGEERKGILAKGQTADLEATFHFDHLFGDRQTPADDDLNRGALGFAPLATLARDGKLNIDTATLKKQLSADDFTKFMGILPSLGHVGEGHCQETQLKS